MQRKKHTQWQNTSRVASINGEGRIPIPVSAITLSTTQYEFIYIDLCLQGRINNLNQFFSSKSHRQPVTQIWNTYIF